MTKTQVVDFAIESTAQHAKGREVMFDGNISSAPIHVADTILRPLAGGGEPLLTVSNLAVLRHFPVKLEKIAGTEKYRTSTEIKFGRYFRYVQASLPVDQIPPLPSGGPRWAPVQGYVRAVNWQ